MPSSGKPTEIDPTFCLAASSSFFFSSACFFCCSSCSSIESRIASININCNERGGEQEITSQCGEWTSLPLRYRPQLPCRIQNPRCPYVLSVDCFGNHYDRHRPRWPEVHSHRWSARWVLCPRRLTRWYRHATMCTQPGSACPRSTASRQRGSVNSPAACTYSVHDDPP